MTWATILIALGLAFVAWKILAGMVKFAAIAGIVVLGGYVLMQGGYL